MQVWNEITDIQKKEILFSKGGMGYRYFKFVSIIILIICIPILLFFLISLFVFGIPLAMQNDFSVLESTLLYGTIPLLGMFQLWLFVTLISYWANVITRYVFIKNKDIIYTYCTHIDSTRNSKGEYDITAIYNDILLIKGQSSFADTRGMFRFDEPSKKLIAYRRKNEDKIYFSYIK